MTAEVTPCRHHNAMVKSYALFGDEPAKPAPPEPVSKEDTGAKTPRCIFCGGTKPTKVYMEGGIVKDGEFVFKFKGIVHHNCAEAKMEEHR